jgi:hypothetical protein
MSAYLDKPLCDVFFFLLFLAPKPNTATIIQSNSADQG